MSVVSNLPSSTVGSDNHPKIRFHATLGGQPQVELALL
jgi:hypothetical protein